MLRIFENGVAFVQNSKHKWGMINQHGAGITSFKYDQVCTFSDGMTDTCRFGYYPAFNGSKFRIRNIDSIESEKQSHLFSEGYALVGGDNKYGIDGKYKYGYIDVNGREVIRP